MQRGLEVLVHFTLQLQVHGQFIAQLLHGLGDVRAAGAALEVGTRPLRQLRLTSGGVPVVVPVGPLAGQVVQVAPDAELHGAALQGVRGGSLEGSAFALARLSDVLADHAQHAQATFDGGRRGPSHHLQLEAPAVRADGVQAVLHGPRINVGQQQGAAALLVEGGRPPVHLMGGKRGLKSSLHVT